MRKVCRIQSETGLPPAKRLNDNAGILIECHRAAVRRVSQSRGDRMVRDDSIAAPEVVIGQDRMK
jgi:hypothetical protein